MQDSNSYPVQPNENEMEGLSKSSKPNDIIGGFFGVEPFEAAIRASRFDIQEELEILIGLIRDPDPKIALPAQRQFRAMLKDVAGANGYFGAVERTQRSNTDEHVIEQKMSTNVLLTNLRRDNEQDRQEIEYEVHKPHEAEVPDPDS